MSQSDVHILDLPDEILLIILKKLNNIDVLYSLLNINNKRLSNLAQEKNFSTILNFVFSDDNYSIDRYKIDQFCIGILPRIHYNVKCLILEPVLMERILLASDYPNLTKLKLFNFQCEIALNYFTNESPLRCIFEQQITDLILMNNDNCRMVRSVENYTRDVYGHILNYFKNLKHLSVNETFNPSYPAVSLSDLPSTTLFSSTLTHLCINTYTLDDCLDLLDGRLKQLTTFIVEIAYMDESSTIVHNMDNLPNLKCFSFKCYLPINQYDDKILPVLHRMSYLENLTLYLRIKHRDTFIDRTHLQNEILRYMPRLRSFTFYICTYCDIVDLFRYVPNQDIRQIVTYFGHQRTASCINQINLDETVCSIFSIPFAFDCLEDIGNMFPDIIFSYVTYLLVHDLIPFNHEFFIRVARAFPLLNKLRIMNMKSQPSCNLNTFSSDNGQSYQIAEYPHLTSLDMRTVNTDYVEQFLNEKKTSVPCLTELTVSYIDLIIVTKNFTRDETRRNCTKVENLIMITTLVHSKDFYLYFPSL